MLFPRGANKMRCRPLIGVDPHRLIGGGRGIQGLVAVFLAFKFGSKVCGTGASTAGSPVGRLSPRNCETAGHWSSFPAQAPPQPSLQQASCREGWLGMQSFQALTCRAAHLAVLHRFYLRAFHSGTIISALSSGKNFLLTVESLLTRAVPNGSL